MSWPRDKNEESKVVVKDFFEEHRRVKAEKAGTQGEYSAVAPKAPRQEAPLSQPSAPQPSTFEALISGLRALGYDTRQLEALREYAARLDEEERKLSEEIQQRQRRLEVVRSARELLRKLGV